ncbi:unnamed protein product [Lampetra planeri]
MGWKRGGRCHCASFSISRSIEQQARCGLATRAACVQRGAVGGTREPGGAPGGRVFASPCGSATSRRREPMAGERRMDELVGELEVERRNLKREKQAVARLQREVARHRGEGSMRERLMCDLESERRLRLESEKRLQEVTRELTHCRTQLRALRDQFERMEETVQDLMRGQSRVNPPAGKATANGSSAQDVISGPDYTPPPRSADAVIPELQTSGVVGDAGFEEERKKIRALLERLQSLEAQNSALSLENESQRDQYERCLDEVANQVVQALLTQKDLREECLKLRTRVCDLEEQNRSMSILFQQKLRLPSEATLQISVSTCIELSEIDRTGKADDGRELENGVAGMALGVVEGGALCRGVGSVPTLGRRRHRLVTSSCSSSSEISLSSTCSELSTHSCPWPAEQRESTAGQVGHHSNNSLTRTLAVSPTTRVPRQGLRQLVSREPIPAPDDRNSLRPGEWTTAHRDLMSSNEGIYSPGSKHNDFPGVVAHASVRLRGVQPHQKCSYESDSQEESEDDARGASLDPVPCKEWTLPSCLRLPHSLSDGLFGPGPRAPFPRTPRCVYQVRGVDERIAGYLPRCQSLGKASENWRFGLTANRMQVSLKGGEEPAGRQNGEGGGGGRSTLGAAPGVAFPNISVSLAQSVHKTVTGQVSSLCGQVISLSGQVTTAGDRPRMLQFVKRAAVAAADAPVKPEEEAPGPAVIYVTKDCCPSQLGSGVQNPGAPALHVRGSARQEVNYTELEPEAASASRAADYAVLESPTEEQPIRDSDGSSGKAAPPAPAGSSTTGNISQVTSGSTSASSGHSHSAAPTLAMSHGAQQRLIKPPYSGGHKSNGLYSAGFAAASSSPSGPRVPLGRMSGKSQSLPQQMKVPCKAGGDPSSGNPPAFRSKSQEKAGGCAPHDKSPGPSSPAKLSRFLKIPSVGSGLGVKSDLANPTRGSPQLPRSSRIPCKSEAAAATKLPNGGGPASPSPEAAPPPGRKPVPEEPVRDSASGGVKPSHLASPPAPPPPGRSASLLIKPNYDIPPSMTLLRPSYDSQQSLLRVRCGKEPQQAAGAARGGAASRLPVGSPTHASKPAVVPRVPQSLHKSQSSISEGVGYSQTLAHVSSHQQPRPNHGSMQQQQQQQKFQLPQSQSEGNMTQNQAILSPKRTVNNVTQHTDATKSCLTMKSPVLIESYNALCSSSSSSNVPERQNNFVANVTTSFTASVRPTNGLNSPPVSSKGERTSDKKELKLEHAHGDPQEVAEALTSVTPPSREPDRASDAATWASKGVPPCPRASDEANSPATHRCASSDLDAKPHPGEGPLPSPLSSPAMSSGDVEFRDELKGLRGTPQSPGTARPYPKPALGMSGTKVRSQSFSAQPGSRERMPATSSAGELSPKIRTHIITNTAERGIPLSRQSSLTTPEPPRVATPSEQQQQQQQEEDHAATELQLCTECGRVERNHGSLTKLPSRLPARAEREKVSTKPDGPRSPTHSERLDDSLPEDGGHRVSPAKVEGVRSPGKLEDFRARQRAPGHRMVPKFDVPESPRRLVQALSPQGSAAGPSIEEKVMQGIQANMLRKEQQGVSRAGVSVTETKPKSGAASSIASWFGFRRHKTAATAAGTAAGTATPAKKMEAPTGDIKKAEVEKQEPKKGGDGKAEVQRKEEKKEWAPLSRRLKPRGKRVEGKQPADKPAPDAQGSRSSPDGSARESGVISLARSSPPPCPSTNVARLSSGEHITARQQVAHREIWHGAKGVTRSASRDSCHNGSSHGGSEMLTPSLDMQEGHWFHPDPDACIFGVCMFSPWSRFHCQMRTLDSGIGTFPPPDPSGRGPPCQQPAAPIHGQPGAPAGGGGRGAGVSGGTAKAKTLDRETAPGVGGGGGCVGDGADRMSHSLSDPSMAARASRAAQSRLPKPVIAGFGNRKAGYAHRGKSCASFGTAGNTLAGDGGGQRATAGPDGAFPQQQQRRRRHVAAVPGAFTPAALGPGGVVRSPRGPATTPKDGGGESEDRAGDDASFASGKATGDNVESLSDSLYDSFSSTASQLSNEATLEQKPRRSLQIQCYQCEEFHLSDCSAPENIANCTVNVQNVCQKEVMVRSNGTFYRKSCASSAACLIASAGYQTFCVPGRMGSVCISCCGTALCNGPRPARRRNSAWRSAPPPGAVAVLLLQLLLLQEQLQLLPVLLPLLPSPPLPRL